MISALTKQVCTGHYQRQTYGNIESHDRSALCLPYNVQSAVNGPPTYIGGGRGAMKYIPHCSTMDHSRNVLGQGVLKGGCRGR